MARKKTTRFDSAVHLDSDEAISAYMEEAMETDDPAFIAYALGQVTRARGMTEIAKQAGLSRESLYKALSAGARPRYETVSAVLRALSVKLTVVAASGRKTSKGQRRRRAGV